MVSFTEKIRHTGYIRGPIMQSAAETVSEEDRAIRFGQAAA